MFIHLFKYRVKCMVADFGGMFWLLFFPLCLSLFFYMGLGNISESKTAAIDAAVVGENEEFLSAAKESGLFNFVDADEDNAKKMLSSEEVKAVFILGDEIKIMLSSNGIYQSISKLFLDTYLQRSETVVNIVSENPAVLSDGFIDELSDMHTHTEEMPNSPNMNFLVVYYYGLIAMAVIMGGSLSLENVSFIQANQSNVACRFNMAPVNKIYAFAAMSSASLMFHFASNLLLIGVLKFVFGVDFTDKIGLVILTVFVGCFSGLMFGALVGSLIKKGEGIKQGIIIAITMLGAFLSGMMSSDIKYYVTAYAPWLKYLLMPELVSDSLYVLYYYETLDKYFLNMGILLAMGIACFAVTLIILSRQKYKSL